VGSGFWLARRSGSGLDPALVMTPGLFMLCRPVRLSGDVFNDQTRLARDLVRTRKEWTS
jgi:hypothetical protein